MQHRIRTALSVLTLALTAQHAHAAGATAPYNEAVQIINGKKVVEVLPLPPKFAERYPSSLRKPGTDGGYTINIAIETPNGLMDCSIAWYHPDACIPSSFGKEKRSREWQVKLNGKWQTCIGQAKPIKCIPIGGGKLRALPVIEE